MNENVHDKILAELSNKLTAHFQPTKLFLFGSQAKGSATAGSDYDFLVVVQESNKSPLKRMQEANRVLLGRTMTVDVFVLTENEFDEWKGKVSSTAHTAITQGKELKVG